MSGQDRQREALDTLNSLGYPRLWGYVTSSVWAIQPAKMEAILEVLSLRSQGIRFTAEEIEARLADTRSRLKAGPFDADQGGEKPSAPSDGVAVIPILGTISQRADLFSESSGGTSTQTIGERFRAAVADPRVGSVLLDVDSPGGTVGGVPELAEEIHRARGKKPVVAVANGLAASAAYWLASAADELVVAPSGEVGSIGVFSVHQDVSGAMERAGVRHTLISAGKFKTEGNPYEPLGEEARAAIQQRVEDYYGEFTRAVARFRSSVSSGQWKAIKVEDVRAGFGEGRTVLARAAVKEGMADRVGTLAQERERLARLHPAVDGATGRRLFVVPAAATATGTTTLEQFAAEHDLPAPNTTAAAGPAWVVPPDASGLGYALVTSYTTGANGVTLTQGAAPVTDTEQPAVPAVDPQEQEAEDTQTPVAPVDVAPSGAPAPQERPAETQDVPAPTEPDHLEPPVVPAEPPATEERPEMADEQTAPATAPVAAAADTAGAQAAGLSLEDYAKVRAENEALKARVEASAKAIAEMQAAGRRARFLAIATGKGEESNGKRWFGDAQAHVGFMEALVEKFGEDSPQVNHYVTSMNAWAEQLHASNLLREYGTDAQAQNDPNRALEGYARELRKENPALTEAQAYDKALEKHPELYTTYVNGR